MGNFICNFVLFYSATNNRHESDFAYYEMDNGILNAFEKGKLTKVTISVKPEQISAHDGKLGLIDALQQKSKGQSVDVRFDT
jgi:hypothetical protein